MIELEMTDELFQSTLPAWGETQARGSALTPWTISIHSPRMGRDAVGAGLVPCPFISIHSPRMGRDLVLWGLDHVVVISIHSPRMGRDLGKYPFAATAYYFNPLSPHGERRELLQQAADKLLFQSTLPAWGETRPPLLPPWPCCAISIHSPRMGRDRRIQHAGIAQRAFQSTLPAWGETCTRYLA